MKFKLNVLNILCKTNIVGITHRLNLFDGVAYFLSDIQYYEKLDHICTKMLNSSSLGISCNNRVSINWITLQKRAF